MYLNIDKNKMKADVLSIVENFIEETYDEEEIRKLTLAEYASMLVQASTAVLNRLVEKCETKSINIDRAIIEQIVQLEVDKVYKV